MLLCVCVCVLAWTCLCICATAASELLVTGSESSSCDVFFTCFSLFLSRPRCVTFNDAQGRLFAVELLWLNFLILLHFGRLYSGFIRGNITIPKHIFLWVLAMLIKKISTVSHNKQEIQVEVLACRFCEPLWFCEEDLPSRPKSGQRKALFYLT